MAWSQSEHRRAGFLKAERSGGDITLTAGGSWLIGFSAALYETIGLIGAERGRPVFIDINNIEELDTVGALLLHRLRQRLSKSGARTGFAGGRPEFLALIEKVAATDRPAEIAPFRRNSFVRLIERLGWGAWFVWREAKRFVTFIGRFTEVMVRIFLQPSRLRIVSLVHHMEQAGLNALPIVGLISFLVGVVTAYQGAEQLSKFGADVFVVNLISISTLREVGILLTAIVIAGRSGSAFTAQIGTMRVREEVDAMRTLGLDPVEVLVVPRVVALVLTMPLLCFFADVMGLLGGGLMAWVGLDISPSFFIDRVSQSVNFWTFMVGMIKAPAFAALIGLVGCYEGLRVKGSAESVGKLTTRSVVQSIFLVIVADALFSIFFSYIGI